MSFASFCLWQRFNVQQRLAAIEATILRARFVREAVAERDRLFAQVVAAERF